MKKKKKGEKLIKKKIKKVKVIKKEKLKGIVHYCFGCKKNTEHKAEGQQWVNYVEYCKKCKKVNYSEILRKI